MSQPIPHAQVRYERPSFDPVPRTWSFDLEMSEETVETGWSALLRPAWLPAVAVLVGGVLLHSMNVLMLATVLPSVVDNLGGATLMSWTSSAFLASSIVAATCTGYLTSILGARTVFCTGAAIFGLGALTCALAPTMGQVVAGRFVQGFGGGLLTAMAYVLVQLVPAPDRTRRRSTRRRAQRGDCPGWRSW